MLSDGLWRFLFSLAICVLMVGILMTRSEPTPLWVMIGYPLVGAALANIASRTSPSADQMARVETTVIAAAAIFVLASLVNLMLLDLLVSYQSGIRTHPNPKLKTASLIILPLISVLLWWALERRLTRFRHAQKARRVALAAEDGSGEAGE